jgi:tetratricopeptide (TPR) repeat protein/formylglycine-generating enzyme required for sulfatase activity
MTAVLVVAAPTFAADDDRQVCEQNDLDRRIAACTRIIDSSSGDSSVLARAHARRGEAYYFKGDNDRAISDLSKAIEANPKDANHYYYRAATFAKKGDHDRAIVDLSQAIEINPKFAEAYGLRAQYFDSKGERERSISDYTEGIRLAPNDARYYNNRGNLHKNKGDNDRALADYNKAIEINPKNASYYYLRSDVYKAKGDLEHAIADYTSAIELDPKNPGAYFERGRAYQNKGDNERAIADFSKVIELNAKHAPAHNHRGVAYRNKGDRDRAIADHSKSIELDPKSALYYNNRGYTYFGKGDRDRAIADYGKAIELNPKYADAYFNRGIALNAKGDKDRAIADFSKTIEFDPKNVSAYANRGKAYAANADRDRAVSDMSKVIELDAKNVAAYLDRAAAYAAKNDQERAIADYTKAVELDAKNIGAYSNRGKAYVAKGEHERAIVDFSKVIDLGANNAAAYFDRAWAYLQAGKPAEALPDAMRSLGQRPNAANTLDTRAHIYEALGRKEDAIADYRKLLELPAPSAADRQRVEIARERIAKLSLPAQTGAQTEKRVAFVVGIDRYDNLGTHAQLQKAVGDANAMAAALSSLEFAVTMEANATRSTFNLRWQEFLNSIAPGDTAAVVFSGHGVEINGVNYLLPRDVPRIRLGRDELLKRESLSLHELLSDLRERRPRFTFIVLDACRDNPFADGGKAVGGARGLARVEPPDGTFIMFSAGAYQTALDRLSDDDKAPTSIYTRTLVPLLKTPGMSLLDMADQVGEQVRDLAATVSHQQTPSFYSGVVGGRRLCIAGCTAASAAPPTKPPSAQCDGVGVGVGASERRCLKPGSGQFFKDCENCPEMVVVPGGSFTMGSPPDESERESEREPQVPVSIATPFAAGKFAVTFDEWDVCVAGGGCNGYRPDDRGWGRGKQPAININWEDAKAYAAWLSRKTGKNYRLLSDAEREYVARAGTTTPFWWGSSITPAQANYNGSAAPYKGGGSKGEYRQRTVPVDSFEPNPWGLHNVHGNVWEWTEDCWNESNFGNPGNGSARTTGDCSRRAVRGGCWDYSPRYLRSASRCWLPSGVRGRFYGFRLARTLHP